VDDGWICAEDGALVRMADVPWASAYAIDAVPDPVPVLGRGCTRLSLDADTGASAR
jgi:hypothetical protein